MCSIPARPIASRLAAASCVPRAGPPGGSRPGRRPRRRTIPGICGRARARTCAGWREIGASCSDSTASHFARRSGDGTIGCIAGGQPGACALARSRDRHRQRCPVSGLAFSAGARLGVEVQGISAAMARRSFAWNGAADRVEIRDGDFRDPALLAGQGSFDLVIGTPPYFPMGTGPQSDRTQRAPCRFEHHGGVEAYCEAAARVLAPGAPFVACEAWIQRERVEPAGRAAGLALSHWREVIPREGKAPLFVVFALTVVARAGVPVRPPPLVVRDRQGRRTPEFMAVREAMGMPA